MKKIICLWLSLSLVFPSMTTVLLASPAALAQTEMLAKFRQIRSDFKDSSQSDRKKTLDKISEAIGKTQDDGEKRLLLMAHALLATDQGDVAAAEEDYKKLEQGEHDLLEYAHYFHGELLMNQKKFDDAKAQFEAVGRLSPNPRLEMDSRFHLALVALEEKKYSQAALLLSRLERRQRHEENYPETIYQLAKAEKGLHRQALTCKWIKKLYMMYPQYSAIESWGPNLTQDVFEGEPTRCPITNEDRRSRIRSLQWAGLNDRALNEINLLRSQSSKEDMYEVDRLQVQYLFQEGDVEQALKILLPYYDSKKTDVNYLNLLAVVAARAGELQVAVGSYYQVYKLAPRGKYGKQALFQAAFLSYQFEDYDGAARKFQEFVKVYASSGLSRDARWHLAWIRYLKGDFSGAYVSMQDLLKASQGLVGKHHRRRRAWRGFPKDRVTYWMAMSLYRQGKYTEAKPLFESLAKDPLITYYSIAAQARLKKMEKFLPKVIRLSYADSGGRIARFTMAETLIPPDDAAAATGEEEKENEDSLTADAMGATETTDENENSLATAAAALDQPPADDSENAATEENQTAELSNENASTFKDPRLLRRFERARDLMILGLNDWAKWDLFDIEKRTRNKEYLKTLIQEYQTIGNYHRSAFIAQTVFGDQRAFHGIDGLRYMWEAAYPKAYVNVVKKYAKSFSVPSELIWGIMRAESIYRKDVVSPVGALGLMQVMPGTAQKIAHKLGEKQFEARELLQPEMAVKIGSRYLAKLEGQFDNNIPLVAASYNAGPHRVKAWLSSFGTLDVDEFVEHIPFLETRNYVKKVVSNYQIYAQLYENKKDSFNYLSEPLNVKVSGDFTKESWDGF
jgi:soluble lytic murein transglycosylase